MIISFSAKQGFCINARLSVKKKNHFKRENHVTATKDL